MSRFPMNRYDEQRLIQEVHYLHSLWHQGPPRTYPQPPIPTHPTPISLQPSSSTKFKKQNNKNLKRLNKEAIIDSGIEWPCPKPSESPPVTESGWGSFKPQPNSQPHLPTDQELANFALNRAHQGALKAVSEYFEYSIDDDDDEDDDEEKGEKSNDFFAKLFEEDGVLREYYEKNGESGGEFSCLVCCGVGKKGWKKRFKDCVALVQHSITIANTRQMHRAYGQVICKILGWDISRLPSIVLTAGDNKPSESSDKPAEAQGNDDGGGKHGLSGLTNTTDTVNIGSDELSQQKQSFSSENQQENGGGSTALEHNSPVEARVSNGIPETAKENTEGASNCPGRSRAARRKAAKRQCLRETAKIEEDTVTESEGLHNSPIEASINNDIPETAKENTEGASNCPGNEGEGGKNSLSGQSNTTDNVNIGSNEVFQQKESSGNSGGSTVLEHNSTSEANENRSLEDVSNGIPETAEENAEDASNCPEPLQEDMVIANERNNRQKDDVSKETIIVSDNS